MMTQPSFGLEKNLDIILYSISKYIHALNYSFYVKHPDNNHYELKAIRSTTDRNTNIEPSYSGLLPYQQPSFKPSLALAKDMVPLNVSLKVVNGISVLMIPIKGGNGVIQLAPFHQLPNKLANRLEKLFLILDTPFTNLLEEEKRKRKYDVLETISKAINFINKVLNQDLELIKLITNLTSTSLNASSSLLIQTEKYKTKVLFSFGMRGSTSQSDYDKVIDSLLLASGKKTLFLSRKGEPLFEQLKQTLKPTNGDISVISKFNHNHQTYFYISWFERKMFSHQNLISIHKFVNQKLNEMLFSKQKLSNCELNMFLLKNLSDMIDHFSPYTVGYSQLMARYSMLIGKELGLSETQIYQIGQAAYLSNIGLLGLSEKLLTKEGLYTKEEYEEMQLHPEIGALIIETNLGDSEIARIIRYHHEHKDGSGYPLGLKDNQIPIGSKIIAVVHTFLAKFKGRSYRDPLPFNEALILLKEATDDQLDPVIVDIFIKWFDQKRMEAQNSGKSLGACWEMCGTPEYICSQCEAFGQTQKNCWEFEKTNCQAHGKECRSCFVYTEAASRIELQTVK